MAARTQLSRLLFGIGRRFAALPAGMPVASTRLTASARNSGVQIPFGVRSIPVLRIVKLHDPPDAILFGLPHTSGPGCGRQASGIYITV